MPIELNKNGSFKTIIEHLISQIVLAKIKKVFVIVNYKPDMIKDYLGNGSKFGCKIRYILQKELDGNAGAYYKAQKYIGESDVLIADCDNYFSNDNIFVEMRKKHENETVDLTVGVDRTKNIKKFAIIKVSRDEKAVDIAEKPTNERLWGNLAKSGVIILSNGLAKMNKKISREKRGDYTTTNIIKYCIDNKLNIFLFYIEGGFNDIGTWDEYVPLLIKNVISRKKRPQ